MQSSQRNYVLQRHVEQNFTLRAVRHLFSVTLTSARHMTHRVRRGNYTSLPYRSFPLIATRGNKRESRRENFAIRFLRKIGTCAATIRLRLRRRCIDSFQGFRLLSPWKKQISIPTCASSSSRHIFFFVSSFSKKFKTFVRDICKDFIAFFNS